MQEIILKDSKCSLNEFLLYKSFKEHFYKYSDGKYSIIYEKGTPYIIINSEKKYLNFNEENKNFFGFSIDESFKITSSLETKLSYSYSAIKYNKYIEELKECLNLTLEIITK